MSDVEVQVINDAARAMVRRLLEKRDEVDELEQKLKRATEELREQEAEAHQALAEAVGDPMQGKSSALPIDLGEPYGRVRVLPTATVFGKVINGEDLMEYLENSGQIDEFTRPSLAKSELNALARRLEEMNATFPPGFDYYIKRGIRVTRQK